MSFNAGAITANLELNVQPFKMNARTALNLSKQIEGAFRGIGAAAGRAADSIASRTGAASKTLDGMRSRLDLLNSRIGRVEVGSKRFQVLSKEISRVKQELDKADRSAGQFGNTLGQALGGAAVTAGVAMLTKSLLDLGGSLEQTETSFRVMLRGEVQKSGVALEDLAEQTEMHTKRVMDSLMQFANVTPFLTDEVLQVGQSFLSFGFASEQLIPIMEKVGNVAAALKGTSFKDLADIIGKAKSQNVIFTEDLNQLSQRGIPILRELAKQFGVSEMAVRKMASEAKIQFADIEKAFTTMTSDGGTFFNLMAEQSKTFNGLLSTLQGKLQTVGAEIGKTAAGLLKPLLSALISLTDRLADAWSGMSKGAQNAVVALAGISLGIIVIAAALPAFKFGLIALSGAIKVVGIQTAIATGGITLLIGAIAALGIMIASEPEKFSEFLDPMNDAIFNLLDNLGTLWESIKSALAPIGRLFAPIAKAFESFAGSMGGAIENISLLEIAIKPVVVWITVMAEWFGLLIKAAMLLGTTIKNVLVVGFEFLLSAGQEVFEIAKLIGSIFTDIISIFGILGKAIYDIGDALGIFEPFIFVINSISSAMFGLFDSIPGNLASVVTDALGNALDKVMGWLFDFFDEIPDKINKALVSGFDDAMGWLFDFFARIPRGAGAAFAEAVAPVKAFGLTLMAVFTGVKRAFDSIMGFMLSAAARMRKIVEESEVLRRIASAIAGAFGAIVSIVQEVWKKVKELGRRLTNFWNQLVDKKSVKGAIEALKGDFKAGTRDLERTAGRAAKNIGKALTAGFKEEDARKAAQKFASGIKKELSDTGKSGAKAARDILDEFERAISGMGAGDFSIQGIFKQAFAASLPTISTGFLEIRKAFGLNIRETGNFAAAELEKNMRKAFGKLKDVGISERDIENLVKKGLIDGLKAATDAIDPALIEKGLQDKLIKSLTDLGVTSEETMKKAVGAGMTQGLDAAAKTAGVDAGDLAKKMDLEKAGRGLELGGRKLMDFLGVGMNEGLDKAAKLGAAGGKGIGKAVAGGMKAGVGAAAGAISAVISGIEQAISNFFSIMQARVKLMQAELKRFEHFIGIASDILQQRNAVELAELESAEQAKIDLIRDSEEERIRIMEAGFLRRQAMRNEELAAAIAAAEAEHARKLELEQIAFERERLKIEEAAAREVTEQQVRQESQILWDGIESDRAQELADTLSGIRTDFTNRESEDSDAFNAERTERERQSAAAIVALEEQKQVRIDALKKEQERKEKETGKAIALTKWTFELVAFEASKQMQIAQANIEYFRGIMQAAAIPLAFGALFGPPGIVAGGIAAAGLISQLSTAYNLTISGISASRPLPPAELFMQQGGPVVGPSHSAGGVRAELEGGEFVVPRRAAAANREILDEITRRGSTRSGRGDVNVTIQNVTLDPQGMNIRDFSAALGREIRSVSR